MALRAGIVDVSGAGTVWASSHIVNSESARSGDLGDWNSEPRFGLSYYVPNISNLTPGRVICQTQA